MKDDLDFCIAFISEIEQNPAIYDYSLPDYSNRRLTEMIWARVGKKFNETGNDCKTKWKSIRSSYIRSLNNKSESGSGAGSKKEYYLAPHLRFLNPFTKSRSQEGNISQISSHTGVEQIDSENSNVSNIEDFNSQDELSSATSVSAKHIMDECLSSPEPNSIPKHQSKKSKPNTHQYREEEFVSSTPSPSLEPNSHSITPSSSIHKNQSKKSKPLSAVDKCAIEYFSLKKQKTELKTQALPNKDSCELFLLSLVPQMQSMTPREQLTFQKGILDLIENIKYPSQEPKQQQSFIILSEDSASNSATTYYQTFSNEVQKNTSTQSASLAQLEEEEDNMIKGLGNDLVDQI